MAINLNALGAETPWTKVTVTQRQIDALCICTRLGHRTIGRRSIFDLGRSGSVRYKETGRRRDSMAHIEVKLVERAQVVDGAVVAVIAA